MKNEELHEALKSLQSHFSLQAIPAHGRYVPKPAIMNDNGVVYIPPAVTNNSQLALKAFSFTAIATLAFMWNRHKKIKKEINFSNQIEVEYNY